MTLLNKCIKHSKAYHFADDTNILQSNSIGMLSRLEYRANLNILRITYHSIFGSNILHDYKIWGQANTEYWKHYLFILYNNIYIL